MVAIRLFSQREHFVVTSRFRRGRPAHPLRNVGDDHRAAQHRATFAHMAATLPPIGGTDAAVRSALLQSLRCLLTRIRIRIRAQSDTTHVSEHDGNHVRSTFAHQRVTVTFHECVIARKTCCSNGLGSHLNADQREQGNTFLMPVGALCIRPPTQSSSLPHTPCRAIGHRRRERMSHPG